MQTKVKLSDYGFSILQVETQSICNMKCLFCPYPIRKDKGIVLPEKYVYKIIDSIDPQDKGFNYICFSQFNEPLLDKRLFKFLKHAKESNLKTLLVTNGLLFDSPEIIDKVINAEPTYIKLSLQILDDNLFRVSRGIDYPFERYKKNILEFLSVATKNKCKSIILVDIACNFLTEKNKSILNLLGINRREPSVPHTLKDLKTGLIEFLDELKSYDSSFDVDSGEFIINLEKLNKDYLNQTGLSINDNITIKIKQFTFGRRLEKFHPVNVKHGCKTNILGILSSGSVTPCCLGYEDKLSMGNIKKDSLKSILNQQEEFISNIRKGVDLTNICKKCMGSPTYRGALLMDVGEVFLNARRG